MISQREALIALLKPLETPAKAIQRLKVKPQMASYQARINKKKNVRKSELARMQQMEKL